MMPIHHAIVTKMASPANADGAKFLTCLTVNAKIKLFEIEYVLGAPRELG